MKYFILILVLVLVILFFKPPNKVVYQPYNIKGYLDLKQDKNTFYTTGGITKIIIKTSWHKRDSFPLPMIDALEQTKQLNQDYELYYFDNDEVDQFMKDIELYDVYDQIVPGAFKADLFRICLLYVYGGCYSDIGHIPLVSFNEICGDGNIVLVSDYKYFKMPLLPSINYEYYGIHNALMCTVPESPFFKVLIDKTVSNIVNRYYGDNDFDITGPVMIGKMFNYYFENKYVHENLMKHGTTDYNGCKVKILKMMYYYNSVGKTWHICDENEKKLIQTKFNDYYHVMYKSGKKLTYHELWDRREVYK